MKRLLIQAVMALCILTPFSGRANAAGVPAKIDVLCHVGQNDEVLVTLWDCGNKVDQHLYGWYWCSGKIDENFAVKYSGYMGTGYGEIRITYLPGKFSGLAPVEIDGLRVNCHLPGSK